MATTLRSWGVKYGVLANPMTLIKLSKTLTVVFITTVIFTGCEKSVPQSECDSIIYEKDQEIEDLENKILYLKEHISTLESHADEVNSQFERLDSENWRDVVPDVDASLDDLNTEISNHQDY